VLVLEGRTQSPQEYVLHVNGQSGQAKVLQVNGHSYVDVDALARLANGSIAYQGSEITLTLPGSPADPAPASHTDQHAATGFSKEFLSSGIEFMSQIREWRNTLAFVIANGYPLSDSLFAPYRDQASTSLRYARLAANTQADKNAAQLLGHEFDNINTLTGKYLKMRANLEFIDPDALSSDALNQKIFACAKSLAAMASSNQFVDDGSCH
jgi:hypothetical protein